MRCGSWLFRCSYKLDSQSTLVGCEWKEKPEKRWESEKVLGLRGWARDTLCRVLIFNGNTPRRAFHTFSLDCEALFRFACASAERPRRVPTRVRLSTILLSFRMLLPRNSSLYSGTTEYVNNKLSSCAHTGVTRWDRKKTLLPWITTFKCIQIPFKFQSDKNKIRDCF